MREGRGISRFTSAVILGAAIYGGMVAYEITTVIALFLNESFVFESLF
jgi:hypothetical protein